MVYKDTVRINRQKLKEMLLNNVELLVGNYTTLGDRYQAKIGIDAKRGVLQLGLGSIPVDKKGCSYNQADLEKAIDGATEVIILSCKE